MPTMTPEELKQKYPEGVPHWMLGHSAEEIDRLMQLRRKILQADRNKRAARKNLSARRLLARGRTSVRFS
jgi:hypothetical protein